MPTGGGKSICFQVPAMMQDGICIVVSPLIALMKDQVENLKTRNIKALCVTSEYNHRQIDAMFDRCIYEPDIKFLYLSPERLKTDMAKSRIAQMNVNLIAVDEAHCISEWGYDFRPPYLEIAQIRPLQPKAPVIALTASATPVVVKDIQEKLEFNKENLFQQSFKRENLAYFIDWDEDKFGKAERIARKQQGSGIIYMRSRKGTERIARELQKRGLRIDYYHAGLSNELRSQKQADWMSGKSQIIAATNAFGMGIDKPDVRFVIHMDIPDTLENYYQECGRAGRDGLKAFAVSILGKKDIGNFSEKAIKAFPEKADIKNVYNALCSFLDVAVGSAKDENFALDLDEMCHRFNLESRQTMLALKFLEREGYILLDENNDPNSTFQFTANHEHIRELRASNKKVGPIIDTLLRSYPRLFDETSSISEWTLAKRLQWPKDKIVAGLSWLHNSEYAVYNQASTLPKVTFLLERIAPQNISISHEHYELRKHVVQNKAEAMLHYVESDHKCRSRLILEYFGESNAERCGICDFCLKNTL